jgi:uncharacterized protein
MVNLRSGECLCVSELADRPLRRMRGLIGRDGLAAGQGLLVSPAPAIHTAFMRFPIDVLFLDTSLRVLDIVERLHPWRIASRRHARAVLELAAGECARREVRVGDQLSLRDGQPASAEPTIAEQAPPPATPEAIIWPGAPQTGGTLTQLHPLRVLVISGDAHFRSVTALLLSHRGCSVTTSPNANRVAHLITRHGADVVLVDGEQPARAQTVAAVAALAQPIGIVVVEDAPSISQGDALSTSQGSHALAKWGRFEDLYGEVERAGRARGTAGASE